MNSCKNALILALCVLSLAACKEIVKVNHVKDVVLTGNASPISAGSWRKMGDFFNENAVYQLLFVVKGRAYFKVTMNYQTLESDFWAYDPVSNTFAKCRELPTKDGGHLNMAIGDKGYFGPGLTFYNGVYTNTNEFWEYDPAKDNWTRKADFMVSDIEFPGIYVIGTHAYVCGWQVKEGYRDFQDVYQYSATADKWTKKDVKYPLYSYRTTPLQFGVNGTGYVFGGGNGTVPNNSRDLDSLYLAKYNPDQNSFSWIKNATFPYPYEPRTSWVLNDKIHFYIGSREGKGNLATDENEVWEFNTTQTTWTKSKAFNGPVRNGAMAFSIGGKAYICFGSYEGKNYNDIWEHNP